MPIILKNLLVPFLVCVSAAVLLGLVRAFRPVIKGWCGEFLLDRLLRHKLDPARYRVLHDIYLPTDDGATTQIDHIVVSQWGVFVVETKTYSGWIFGDAKAPQWTVSHFKRKNRFQNPLRQNYKHLATLSECLGIPIECFKTVIAFSGDAEFKTEMPPEVLHFGEVADYILRQSGTILIPPEQIREVEAVILEWQRSLSRERKAAHVQNLRKNHPQPAASVPPPPDDAIPVCPKCGAPMVRRTRRSDGGEFWGCSRFPSCRGIRDS